MPRWPAKSEELIVEAVPERKEWDKKCELCGSKCMMENPEVYDIEVFECQNPQCRAQFTIKTFYDKKGKFTGEEYLGKTMGSVT
jgi:hypothetical protein